MNTNLSMNNIVDWTTTSDLVGNVKVDEVGVLDRVSSLATRSIKRESKLDALEKIVSMCDLTTLEGEDTEGKIIQMSSKAMSPDPNDDNVPSAAAVCVYPALVSTAKKIVKDSNVKVASVSSYFPSGQAPIESKISDTQFAIDEGADEIDIVINRKAFFEGDYKKVYEEIKALKDVCGEIHLKTILEIGELKTYENIKKASVIALCAGSDFIKTSTGKISNGSSREACLIMARTVREFESYGYGMRGIKVAGGIRDAKDAIRYLVIINEELGDSWLSADYFRFGASSLLDDVLKQIKKLKTNAYQSSYYFPRG
ncbi:deoxyribose-phosphate aldolase [Acidimicrobiaceae bacterium]|nr:deoxyribose-phosphate aldolase [Acidimicrobiaceae bacterium]MDC3051927.1 deoxyribose-phosphate aldolase [Acidimicrobiaceae bacterium]